MRRAPRPVILDRLRERRHAVVEASAGTGKTFTLEHLVVDLVLRDGLPLDRILVVTFTEKAANELKVRIRSKLRALLESPSPTETMEPAWVLDNLASERLTRAVLAFDRATVATIHAFCQRVLLDHAFEHRRPFQQSLVDGRAAFERAFMHVLRTELARDPQHRGWLEAWLEQGSLESLLDLCFECAERGGVVRPRFDPATLHRALKELQRAPTAWRALRPALVRGKVSQPTLRKTQERLEALLRAAEIGEGHHPARFLAQLEDEEDDLLERLLEPLRSASDRQPNLQHLASVVEALARSVAPLKAAIVQAFLPPVLGELASDKARRGELDFSDMLRLLDESLSGGEHGARLASTLRERYPVALIDEFQDTDEVQWRIFRRLYLEAEEAAEHPPRLFVIGDPKQAIYGFRGADVSTYLAARAEIEDRGGLRVALERSFRSTPPLVEALHALFDPSARPPFFPGPIKNQDPVTAGRTDDAGLLEGGRKGPSAVMLQPALDDGAGVGEAESALAASITGEIEQLLDGAQALFQPPEGPPRPLEAREIFVLTRSAREGRLIQRSLVARGLPAALYKQEGLFQSQEARDIRALLAAVAEPHRLSLALRAWRTPFFGVPLERLADCRELRGSDPLVARLLEWKARADRREYAQLFAAILEESGLTERLLFQGGADRALTNYLHLFEILAAEARQGRPSLFELVHRFAAFVEDRARPSGQERNIERLESDDNAVQVMSMHKAKGLEAEVVFLFGGLRDVPGTVHPFHEGSQRCLFVGAQPPPEARIHRDEEARRLLYVALTRARTRLYVPFFGPGDSGSPIVTGLSGPQALLEPHLCRLIDERAAGWALRSPEPGFACRPQATDLADRLSAFTPPDGLLEAPRGERASYPRRRWGPVVTSYSRMKSERDAGLTPALDPLDPDEGVSSAGRAPGLPAGAASGRFLHDVLERVSFPLVQGRSLDDWRVHPETAAVLEGALQRHRRAPEHRADAERLVWQALTTPLRLRDNDPLAGGLAAAPRIIREMPFLFPIPADPSSGFVKGFIDVVFEHDAQVYVLDWKSDALDSYAADRLDAHVRQNYLLQAEIYAIAVTRFLGIGSETSYEARFGGTIYGFVRGFPDAGQWFFRPSWSELLSASARLEALKPPRGPSDGER